MKNIRKFKKELVERGKGLVIKGRKTAFFFNYGVYIAETVHTEIILNSDDS